MSATEDKERERFERWASAIERLTRERDEARRQLQTLECLPESDKKEIADFKAFLGMPEANLQTMDALRAELAQARADLAACASNGWITPEVKLKAEAMDAVEQWLSEGSEWRAAHLSKLGVGLFDEGSFAVGQADRTGQALSAAILSAVEQAKQSERPAQPAPEQSLTGNDP